MNKLLKYSLILYCGSLLAITDVTHQAQIDESLANDVLVVLVTPWCSICKAKSFIGALEEYESKYPATKVLRVDAEKYPSIERALLKKAYLRKKDLGYPTILIFKKGSKPRSIIGQTDVAELERAFGNQSSVVKHKKKKATSCPVISTKMVWPDKQK